MAACVILLRHAEKASDDGRVKGVDARGAPDTNDLCVRGWQRAGALARFFAPGGGDLGVPQALFAGAPTEEHPSRRSISTLAPLAERLGLPLNMRLRRGQEAELAAAATGCDGPVLVAWDHRHLPALARAFTRASVPPQWPEGCFDRFWILTREGADWRFEQRPQRLLGGDE
jgi:hypothetical protein